MDFSELANINNATCRKNIANRYITIDINDYSEFNYLTIMNSFFNDLSIAIL